MYVIYGQTATGKTAKAVELARQYNGELINADSRQIYRHLYIVTGKDIPKRSIFNTQASIENKTIGYYKLLTSDTRHPTNIWLYDIIDPKQTFSSTEYVLCAKNVIENILARGKTPILVGGTGFYLQHLLFGFSEENTPPNWELRKKLEKKSVKELQALLTKKKPEILQKMNESDRNNPRRLIRQIEKLDGVKHHNAIDSRLSQAPTGNPWGCQRVIPFFHSSPMQARTAITKRVHDRIEKGAIEEVKKLLDLGCTENDPGLNAIGYKQLILHLRGVITLDAAIQDWITKEVQYAKRQKTFFKKYFTGLT